MTPTATSARRSRSRFRLTERDFEIAAFVDRVGRTTVAQVRELFELSERVAWRRVQALEEMGALRSIRPWTAPKVLLPPRARVPHLRELDHALTTTAVVVDMELRGAEVVTERMMRRQDRSGTAAASWRIMMPSPSGSFRPLTHRPDAAMRGEPGLTALEVELSRKSGARLRRILKAWARQGQYAEVVYMCPSSAVRDLVAREALAAGADLVVRVEQLPVSEVRGGWG